MKHVLSYEIKNNQIYIYIKDYERDVFINKEPRKINFIVEPDTNFRNYKELYAECYKLKMLLKLKKNIQTLNKKV